MSYQALARKYRPQLFTDVVGQQQVLKALKVALDCNRLHHAYLFTGTRGVGKTTVARIFAKSLNCEQGISSTPCGRCRACVEIVSGCFVDLIEVDAASRTKVEDTRELLDNVLYAPTVGRFKVYLIDEVHMLSTHSFNALLKTLEEPPEHVKFLLATTDPQKLPVTVLSRCLQFALKNMVPNDIVQYLQDLLPKEQVPFEGDALWLLAKSAEGSMRDALSLTDQAIAVGDGEIKTKDVAAMLGTLDRGKVIALSKAILAGNIEDVLQIIDQLNAQNTHFDRLLAELLEVFHQIALQQWSNYLSSGTDPEIQWIRTAAQETPAENVQLYYQVLLIARRDLKLAANPRQGFEMALLRMLTFKPTGVPATETGLLDAAPDMGGQPVPKKPNAADGRGAHLNQLKSQLDVLGASKAGTVRKVGLQPKGLHTQSVTEFNDGREVSRQNMPTSGLSENGLTESSPSLAEPTLVVMPEKPIAIQKEDVRQKVPTVEPDTVTATRVMNSGSSLESALADIKDPVADWPLLFEAVAIDGLTRSLFEQSCLRAVDGNLWHIEMRPEHFQWVNETHTNKVKQALTELIERIPTLAGFSCDQIKVVNQLPSSQTPADYRAQKRADRQKVAENAIMSDPIVRQILELLDAQVIPGSLKPIDED